MRSRTAQQRDPQPRPSNHKDMFSVVQNVILALEPPSGPTVFHLDETEIFHNLLYQIRRDCPNLSKDPNALVDAISAV